MARLCCCLAPEVQARLLTGDLRCGERPLREVASEPDWEKQRGLVSSRHSANAGLRPSLRPRLLVTGLTFSSPIGNDPLSWTRRKPSCGSEANSSFGSQSQSENAPPLGCTFFSRTNTRILARLLDYPVLKNVWSAQGSPSNLEVFWTQLDDEFNRDENHMVAQRSLIEAIEASRTAPAHASLCDYYELYSSGDVPLTTRAQAVAGFELKCLIQDVLRKGPQEWNRLRALWSILRVPLRVVTFNYDLYIEMSCLRDGRQYSYGSSLSREVVDVFKLHGSIQWTHQKYCDRFGRDRFQWADDGNRTLDFREAVMCDSPESWFGSGCHPKECFHLADPIMIGLRQKREFEGGEGNPKIRRFFGRLLHRSQEALSTSDRVVVIGFSFSEADDYLWRHLSWKQLGSRERLLCCYVGQDRAFENRVQEFFGTEAQFVRSGFGEELLSRLTDSR